MSKKPKSYFKYLLAFDSETTGVCIGNNDPLYNSKTKEQHQALSWGIMVIDADTLDTVEELYLEVKWNSTSKFQYANDNNFGQYAEKVHGLTYDYLEENGIEEDEAVTEIANLIVKYWGTTSPINSLGHNIGFDIRFLGDLFERYQLPFRFSQRNIDTTSIGFTCWKTYDSDAMFDQVTGKERTEHNALEDIQLTVEVVRTTRLLFQHLLDGGT